MRVELFIAKRPANIWQRSYLEGVDSSPSIQTGPYFFFLLHQVAPLAKAHEPPWPLPWLEGQEIGWGGAGIPFEGRDLELDLNVWRGTPHLDRLTSV